VGKRENVINKLRPSFAEEDKLRAQGYRLIAGIDEAGRGSLAGPVVAGAVVLPGKIKAPWVDKVRDSKMLNPAQREFLFDHIIDAALAVGTGVIHRDVIDNRGIVPATRLAMKMAVDYLSPPPECLLVDYMNLPEVPLPQRGITDGDALCLTIACASIVAKVTRDRLMIKLGDTYPGYGLAQNKGYYTEGHFSCLCRQGPSPIHRRSFEPVRTLIERNEA
jgi:ribonuclease HII